MSGQTPNGAHERHQLLEEAQNSLVDTLGTEHARQVLGEIAIKRILDMNGLLTIPNIRNGRVVMPAPYHDTDAIPFMALEPGENVQLDRSLMVPAPTQVDYMRSHLEHWQGEGSDVSAMQDRLLTIISRKTPKETLETLGEGASGGLGMNMTHIYGESLGLDKAQDDFFVRGRPDIVLNSRGGYPAGIVLAYEMIHLEQALDDVFVPADKRIRLTKLYVEELEAHHYSAQVADIAISMSSDPGTLRRSADVSRYRDVEAIRDRLANPDEPFTPNEAVVHALRDIGVVWGIEGQY